MTARHAGKTNQKGSQFRSPAIRVGPFDSEGREGLVIFRGSLGASLQVPPERNHLARALQGGDEDASRPGLPDENLVPHGRLDFPYNRCDRFAGSRPGPGCRQSLPDDLIELTEVEVIG